MARKRNSRAKSTNAKMNTFINKQERKHHGIYDSPESLLILKKVSPKLNSNSLMKNLISKSEGKKIPFASPQKFSYYLNGNTYYY